MHGCKCNFCIPSSPRHSSPHESGHYLFRLDTHHYFRGCLEFASSQARSCRRACASIFGRPPLTSLRLAIVSRSDYTSGRRY